MATGGLVQGRASGEIEPPIVTSGDCLNEIRTLLKGRTTYFAADVIEHLRSGIDETGSDLGVNSMTFVPGPHLSH